MSSISQSTPARLAAVLEAQPPVAVARPDDAHALAAQVDEAAATGRALWPIGSALDVRLPAQLAEDWVLLDTRGLAEVHDLDRRSAVAHVGAGCTVERLESALRAAGLTLGEAGEGLAPAATLGGLVSRHWPWPPTFGRPTVRSACIGLTAYFGAGGARYHYLPAPRKASGPDLRHFFLGAEGRCGVISELWLAAQRLPEADVSLVLRADAWPQALSAVRALLAAGMRPWRCTLRGVEHGVELDLRLAGAEPLVSLWHQQARELLTEVEGPTAAESAAEPAALEVAGDWDSIARAVELAPGARVSAATLPGAHLALDAGAASGAQALLELPWYAVLDRRAPSLVFATAPGASLAGVLGASLGAGRLWLASSFSTVSG